MTDLWQPSNGDDGLCMEDNEIKRLLKCVKDDIDSYKSENIPFRSALIDLTGAVTLLSEKVERIEKWAIAHTEKHAKDY